MVKLKDLDEQADALNYTFISEYFEYYDTADGLKEKYGSESGDMVRQYIGNFYEEFFKSHEPYNPKKVCEQCKTCKNRCGYGETQDGYSVFRGTLIDDYLFWGCLGYGMLDKPEGVYNGKRECRKYEKE